MIRALIVEDELEGVDNLMYKLKKHCPSINVIGVCETAETAIRAIKEKLPQLVFLDIRLRNMSGFDVLEKVQHIPFEVIFTTSYDEYAIQAIRISAVDYILKPIKPSELVNAVIKAQERIEISKDITRILVPDGHSQVVLPIQEIMYCIADNTSTYIHRHQNKALLVVKTLKFIEAMLTKNKFFRISRSAIVNLEYVDAVHRTDGRYLVMRDGKEFSISKSQFEPFMVKLSLF